MKGTDKVLTAIYSVGGQPTRWVFFFVCFFLSTTAIPVLMRPFIKVSWSKVYTFYIFMEFIPRKWFVCVSGSSRVPPSTTSDSCHADTSFCSCRSFLHLSSSLYQTEIINLSVAVFPQMTVAAMERMFDMLTGDYLACTPPTCKLFSFLTFPLLQRSRLPLISPYGSLELPHMFKRSAPHISHVALHRLPIWDEREWSTATEQKRRACNHMEACELYKPSAWPTPEDSKGWCMLILHEYRVNVGGWQLEL